MPEKISEKSIDIFEKGPSKGFFLKGSIVLRGKKVQVLRSSVVLVLHIGENTKKKLSWKPMCITKFGFVIKTSNILKQIFFSKNGCVATCGAALHRATRWRFLKKTNCKGV